MNIFEHGGEIIIENPENFDLSDTFECGQCFRFNKTQTGADDYEGTAFGKYLRIYHKDGNIYLKTNSGGFNNIWRSFFDLDRDYKKISETFENDEILKKAAEYGKGIRILKQEPFECLISFIITQNNNIPRIKKIIERLCENFGEKIISDEESGRIFYAFPTAEKIAELDLSDLDVIKSGFRAKYIHEAAKRIHSGEINLNDVYDLDSENGAEYLKQLKGVGNKVASCVLLFSYNKLDAFPVDVWIKKVLEKYYPSGFDYKTAFGAYAGLANSYLFNYERKNNQPSFKAIN
jgi:N-glycosylase/DNA lyase